MKYIALCDDDEKFITYMKQIILHAEEDEKNICFYEYTSGRELLHNLESVVNYDLLVLDMQLGDMDGDEIAKHFRKKCPNAVLVFCSGVQLPTVKSFKATPFRYLLKSYSNYEFIQEMKEIMKEVNRNVERPYLIGHYRYNSMKVQISNIMYVENAKRGSRAVVSPESEEDGFEGQILIDEKLAELYEKLQGLGFAYAHRSYIVNLKYVKKIVSNSIVLYSGEILSISRTYYKEFREKFAWSVAGKY